MTQKPLEWRFFLIFIVFLPVICTAQMNSFQKKAYQHQFHDMEWFTKRFEVPVTNHNYSIQTKSPALKHLKSEVSIELIDSSLTYTFTSALDSMLDSKTCLFYDTNGNNTLGIGYYWNTLTKQWIDSWKFESLLDENGFVTMEIDYNWDTISNKWIGSNKYEYNNDSNGNDTLGVSYTLDTSSKQWINANKFEFKYNSLEEDTFEIVSNWDITSNYWIASWENKFNYDAYGNVKLEIDANWDTNSNKWIELWKYAYTYKSDGSETVEIDSYWNETTNEWINYWQYDYFFNSNGNETLEIESYFDIRSNQWILDSKEYWYNSIHSLSNGIGSSIPNSVKLYPNPANQIFNLVTDDISLTEGMLYNSMGQIIKTLYIVRGTNTYDIRDLKSGIYFICIPTKNGMKVQKLVKAR